MSSHDWRWRIGEAVERIRSRYDYIGRKTGAPFLALVYPPEVEVAVLKEWKTQTAALRPEFDVRMVDALVVKGAKIAGADIVPTTQLYTEDYMVKFLVQNSLGATWMGMHPESRLYEGWEYYVRDADRAERNDEAHANPR